MVCSNITLYKPVLCCRFINTTTGWMSGQGSVLMKTTNGGTTWTQQMNQGIDMWGLYMQSATTGWACGGFNSATGKPNHCKNNQRHHLDFSKQFGCKHFYCF